MRKLFICSISILSACASDRGSRIPASVPGHVDGRGVLRPGSGAVNPGTNPNACTAEILGKIDMGQGFSATDVLSRIRDIGNASGPSNDIYGYKVVNDGFRSLTVPALYRSVEFDRQILAPWFYNSNPDVPGSDVYEAARDSVAFSHAIGFVNGKGQMLVEKGQADFGHRISAILATMFASAQQGQADCVGFIRREFASKMLNEENLKILDQIQFGPAAELVKEGRLEETFAEVQANRAEIYSRIEAADMELKAKEGANKAMLDQLKLDMAEAYHDLKLSLADIAPCKEHVGVKEKLLASKTEAGTFAANLVRECKTKIVARLTQIRQEELQTKLSLKSAEDSIALNQKRVDEAKEKGRPEAEITRREGALKLAQERKVKAEEKLGTLASQSETYNDYLAQLSNPEASSVTLQLDRVNSLLKEEKERRSGNYFREDKKAIEQMRGELKINSSNYVTLGWFGGFAPEKQKHEWK